LNHRVETLRQFSGKLTRGPWTSHRNRHVLVAGRRVHLRHDAGTASRQHHR
jgi:hypothetical protein